MHLRANKLIIAAFCCIALIALVGCTEDIAVTTADRTATISLGPVLSADKSVREPHGAYWNIPYEDGMYYWTYTAVKTDNQSFIVGQQREEVPLPGVAGKGTSTADGSAPVLTLSYGTWDITLRAYEGNDAEKVLAYEGTSHIKVDSSTDIIRVDISRNTAKGRSHVRIPAFKDLKLYIDGKLLPFDTAKYKAEITLNCDDETKTILVTGEPQVINFATSGDCTMTITIKDTGDNVLRGPMTFSNIVLSTGSCTSVNEIRMDVSNKQAGIIITPPDNPSNLGPEAVALTIHDRGETVVEFHDVGTTWTVPVKPYPSAFTKNWVKVLPNGAYHKMGDEILIEGPIEVEYIWESDWKAKDNADGTVTIQRYWGLETGGDFVVPGMYGDKVVTALESTYSQSAIFPKGTTSVTLPESITVAGDGAFFDCPKLTNVVMPNVTKLGECAFDWDESLKSVDMSKITSCGHTAFAYCKSIESIDIPSTVTYLGNYVFEGWTPEQTIHISDEVDMTKWGPDWYKGSSATITGTEWNYKAGRNPDTCILTRYNGSATDIIVPETWHGKRVIGLEGCSYSDGRTTSISSVFPETTVTVTLPGSVGMIGDYTFYNLPDLTTVNAGNVSIIGAEAFRDCPKFTGFPTDGLTDIGEFAFSGCTAMAATPSFELASNLDYVGESAFDALTSETLIVVNRLEVNCSHWGNNWNGQAQVRYDAKF